MSFPLKFSKQADEDLIFHKRAGNKANLNKIIRILEELSIHPFTGIGKPELLKHDLSGKWSRRINHYDRLVYEFKENKILIHSAKGHY